jgi:hypothetical protein
MAFMAEAKTVTVRVPVRLIDATTGAELPIHGLELVSKDYLDRVAHLIASARALVERDDAARSSGLVRDMGSAASAVREALKAVDIPQKVRIG